MCKCEMDPTSILEDTEQTWFCPQTDRQMNRQTDRWTIAGTLGCVFIDNETHESGVIKCTTGEAWSAFSWHHSSVFHCQWTHNQVFLLLSHMLIKNAKSIFIYVMKYMCLVSFESWELILHFLSSGLMKLDETISNCWCPIVMKWSLWLQQWSLRLHHCDVIHWDKQSCATMAFDLYPVRFCHLTFNLCVSHTLHANPWNHWYAQGHVW